MTENSFEYKTLRFLNDRVEIYDISENALKTQLYDIPENEINEGMTSLRNKGYIKNKDLREMGLTITEQGQIRLNQMQKVVDSEKKQLSSSHTSEIKALESQIKDLKKVPKGYSKALIHILIPIMGSIITGAYFLGKDNGASKFD